jgi:1-deoxy-D-xylulose-5-phosphate reductoisomerase
MKRLAILGSTGSIGRSALAVVDAHPTRLSVVGLAAGRRADDLAAQIARYRPSIAALTSDDDLPALREAASKAATITTSGPDGLIAVATHPDVDIVLCASSGTAALEAVMAGALVTKAARARGVPLLPVDSEHNAIHQCLHGRPPDQVTRLILTASGGPFRTWPAAKLEHATPEDALRHPTWQMGRKITIDSATLMNKGLEVIEAHWLFDVPADRIEVLIHPQSIVHSMVELKDGSTIAQLGVTDMRLPIQYAFSYPDRWDAAIPTLDLTRSAALEFASPDLDRFPCLRLAYQALNVGGTMMVALNAANEVAVDAFLAGRLPFPAISRVIDGTMAAHDVQDPATVEIVRAADQWAREHARTLAGELELKV